MADRQLFTAAVAEIDPIADLAPPADGLAGSLVRSTERRKEGIHGFHRSHRVQQLKNFLSVCIRVHLWLLRSPLRTGLRFVVCPGSTRPLRA